MLILTLVFLAACTGDETVAAYGGAGKVWQLREMESRAVDAIITLELPGAGVVRGQAPCNGYSGDMTAPYPWFELRNLVTTRAACPDQATENRYLTALQAATLVEVSGNTMILSGNGIADMVFSAIE